MNLYDEISVYFCNEVQELCIGQGSIDTIFEGLLYCLEKSIDNQLQLHESFAKDLGVMCNEYLRDKTGFFTVPLDDGSGDTWVATEYEVCFVHDQDIDSYAVVWLYNDQQKNIILEVFALYKWSFLKDDLEDEDFVTYDEFLKNYTSLLKKNIPHNVAVAWLGQVKIWYELFDKNRQKTIQDYEFQEKNPGPKELIFEMSSDECMKITSDYDFDFQYLYLCSDITVTFEFKNKQTLKIGRDIAGEIFRSLILHLEKAIDNKLQLHESLTQNLGYLYNEYFDDRPASMIVPTEDGPDTHWVIYDYKLWFAYDKENYNVNTWLYNDIKGDIVLEVSKNYPWFYIQEGDIERPDFIYYEDFIKDYKPLLRSVISRDVAILWLQDAKKWLSIFSVNEKKCRKQVLTLKKDN